MNMESTTIIALIIKIIRLFIISYLKRKKVDLYFNISPVVVLIAILNCNIINNYITLFNYGDHNHIDQTIKNKK